MFVKRSQKITLNNGARRGTTTQKRSAGYCFCRFGYYALGLLLLFAASRTFMYGLIVAMSSSLPPLDFGGHGIDTVNYFACVNSAGGDFGRRRMMRSIASNKVDNPRLDYVFVVGRSHEKTLHDELAEEQAKYGDVLMDDGTYDSFLKVSHKVDACVKYFLRHSSAHVVLKLDDDAFVHWDGMIPYLDRLLSRNYANAEMTFFGLPGSALEGVTVNGSGGEQEFRFNLAADFYGLGRDLARSLVVAAVPRRRGDGDILSVAPPATTKAMATSSTEDAAIGVAKFPKASRVVEIELEQDRFLYLHQEFGGSSSSSRFFNPQEIPSRSSRAYEDGAAKDASAASKILAGFRCSESCQVALHDAVLSGGAVEPSAIQQCKQDNPIWIKGVAEKLRGDGTDAGIAGGRGWNSSNSDSSGSGSGGRRCAWHRPPGTTRPPVVPRYQPQKVDLRENGLWWESMGGAFKGESIFLLGNAPSLNKLPLHLLQGQKVLVFNRWYLMQERFRTLRPYFYMCMDSAVCPDIAPDILKYGTSPAIRAVFMPYEMRRTWASPPTIYEKEVGTGGHFRWFYFGRWNQYGFHYNETTGERQFKAETIGTVASTGMEIMAYLGFSNIYIAGVDMFYKGHTEIDAVKITNIIWNSTADTDADHFDHRYFGKGRLLKDPDVAKVMLPSFKKAKRTVERRYNGTDRLPNIYNIGIGGNLNIFPRKSFREVLPSYSFLEEIKLLLQQMPLLGAQHVNLAPTVKTLKDVFVGSEYRKTCFCEPVTHFLVCPLEAYVANKKCLIVDYMPHGPVGDEIVLMARSFRPLNTSKVQCS